MRLPIRPHRLPNLRSPSRQHERVVTSDDWPGDRRFETRNEEEWRGGHLREVREEAEAVRTAVRESTEADEPLHSSTVTHPAAASPCGCGASISPLVSRCRRRDRWLDRATGGYVGLPPSAAAASRGAEPHSCGLRPVELTREESEWVSDSVLSRIWRRPWAGWFGPGRVSRHACSAGSFRHVLFRIIIVSTIRLRYAEPMLKVSIFKTHEWQYCLQQTVSSSVDPGCALVSAECYMSTLIISKYSQSPNKNPDSC